MRIIIFGISLLLSQFITAQHISYDPLTDNSIQATDVNVVYECEGELVNTSDSSIIVTYNRLKRDIPSSYWLSSICTEIQCYYVSLNTVTEEILPNSTHYVDLRWMISEDELLPGVGYTEWEIREDETGWVVDTISCEISSESSVLSNKEEVNELIKIFPNPVSSLLNIEIENKSSLKLYTLSGSLVLSTEIMNNQVDVSYLRSGVYIGKVDNGKEVVQFKIVKI